MPECWDSGLARKNLEEMGERGSQMVEAVIFDMDGLMFDTERVWNDAWPDVLAKFGLTYREGLIEACRATAGSVMDERLAQFYSPDEVDVSLIRKELFSTKPADAPEEAAPEAEDDELELLDFEEEPEA